MTIEVYRWPTDVVAQVALDAQVSELVWQYHVVSGTLDVPPNVLIRVKGVYSCATFNADGTVRFHEAGLVLSVGTVIDVFFLVVPWPLYQRLVSDGSGGYIIYKDYDLPGPPANNIYKTAMYPLYHQLYGLGGDKSRSFLVLVDSGTVTVTFNQDIASVACHGWTVSCSWSGAVLWLSPSSSGPSYVVVTANNGEVFILPVLSLPSQQPVNRIQANFSIDGGWVGRIVAPGDLRTIPYGLWLIRIRTGSDVWAGVDLLLWQYGDQVQYDALRGETTFTLRGARQILRRMAFYPVLVRSGDCENWECITDLTFKKLLYFLLRYHTTALSCLPVFFGGYYFTDRTLNSFEFKGRTIKDALDELMGSAFHLALDAREGGLAILQDPWYFRAEGFSDEYDLAIVPGSEILGDVKITTKLPRYSSVRMGGFYRSGTEFLPAMYLAPAHPLMEGVPTEEQGKAPLSQNELAHWAERFIGHQLGERIELKAVLNSLREDLVFNGLIFRAQGKRWRLVEATLGYSLNALGGTIRLVGESWGVVSNSEYVPIPTPEPIPPSPVPDDWTPPDFEQPPVEAYPKEVLVLSEKDVWWTPDYPLPGIRTEQPNWARLHEGMEDLAGDDPNVLDYTCRCIVNTLSGEVFALAEEGTDTNGDPIERKVYRLIDQGGNLAWTPVLTDSQARALCPFGPNENPHLVDLHTDNDTLYALVANQDDVTIDDFGTYILVSNDSGGNWTLWASFMSNSANEVYPFRFIDSVPSGFYVQAGIAWLYGNNWKAGAQTGCLWYFDGADWYYTTMNKNELASSQRGAMTIDENGDLWGVVNDMFLAPKQITRFYFYGSSIARDIKVDSDDPDAFDDNFRPKDTYIAINGTTQRITEPDPSDNRGFVVENGDWANRQVYTTAANNNMASDWGEATGYMAYFYGLAMPATGNPMFIMYMEGSDSKTNFGIYDTDDNGDQSFYWRGGPNPQQPTGCDTANTLCRSAVHGPRHRWMAIRRWQ